jgi:hypothetical protein
MNESFRDQESKATDRYFTNCNTNIQKYNTNQNHLQAEAEETVSENWGFIQF